MDQRFCTCGRLIIHFFPKRVSKVKNLYGKAFIEKEKSLVNDRIFLKIFLEYMGRNKLRILDSFCIDLKTC